VLSTKREWKTVSIEPWIKITHHRIELVKKGWFFAIPGLCGVYDKACWEIVL
jgi:hypothetical protein